MTPLAVAQSFVACINTHDVRGLATLVTVDHRFTDSLGTVVEGRDTIRSGWQAYFTMVPDYHLEIGQHFNADAEVVLLGVASGSYSPDGRSRPSSTWSTPVAIRATIRDNMVAEWQVYADNEPLRQQMRDGSA
jgi:ketosteroid isomerase-like protein